MAKLTNLSKLKPRQRVILRALEKLGGKATTQQIAQKAELNVNGVSQTLGALSARGYVSWFCKDEKERGWALETEEMNSDEMAQLMMEAPVPDLEDEDLKY